MHEILHNITGKSDDTLRLSLKLEVQNDTHNISKKLQKDCIKMINNKSMRVLTAALLLLGVLLSRANVPLARGQEIKTRKADVDIQVVDGLGGVVEDARIMKFKSSSSGHDFASRFHRRPDFRLSATALPYGKYEMLVHPEGFGDLEVPVDVFQTDVSLEVCARTATVHIVALNSFGTINLGVIRVGAFRDRANDIDWATRFRENKGASIPFGSYLLQADGDNLRPVQQQVEVFQPEVWVVVGLNVASELPHFIAPTWELSGTINGVMPDEEPLYVKLSGIYFDFSMDDKVKVAGSSGTFALKGSHAWGKYLLITMGKSGILDVRPIDIRAQNSITIDLAQQRAGSSETTQ